MSGHPLPLLAFSLCAFLTAGCEILNPVRCPSEIARVKLFSPCDIKASRMNYPDGSQRWSEDDYIAQRRKAVGDSGSKKTLGVALSGGGIRSATISLGALQGLEDAGILKDVDYLSCVSGGAYIGGWYVSHLRSAAELKAMKDQGGFGADVLKESFSSSRADLLDVGSHGKERKDYPLYRVRSRESIMGPGLGKYVNGTLSLGHLLLTWAPNLVEDLALHFQPAPGKGNNFHPYLPYRNLLENYYIWGWKNNRLHPHALLSEDVNRPGSETPFFIASGALANSGDDLFDHGTWREPIRYVADTVQNSAVGRIAGWQTPNLDIDNHPQSSLENNLFEMTSLWCGSPATGYIPTPYFDRSVLRVEETETGKQACVLAGPIPNYKSEPFRLSSAVATSGAAVDAGVVAKKVRITVNYLLTALNVNLRFQAPNFNQRPSTFPGRIYDRVREITSDRTIRSPESNVLQISDGGHFENLGLYALLRRGVPTILAFDATMDERYKYGDLRNLLKLCGQEDWKIDYLGQCIDKKTGLPAQFNSSSRKPPTNPVWHFKVTNPRGETSDVYYVKSSYVWPTAAHDAPGLSIDNPLALRPPVLGSINPGLDDGNELRKEPGFPHIGTFTLFGWSQHRFDSYRDLGRLMGRVVSNAWKVGQK